MKAILDNIFILSLLLCACGRQHGLETRGSEVKIKSGQIPPAESIVAQSTVALLHSESVKQKAGQSFCSGTLIASNLALTAAHCVVGKKAEDFRLQLSNAASFPVLSFQTFKSEQKYGVNFDVAWVKFEGVLPEGFHPVPILREEAAFTAEVTVAGYGQTASQCPLDDSSCGTGRLFEAKTAIADYVNRGRWFNLILVKSADGQGPCLGDSGGPLFKEWKGATYVAGNFVGWDKRLVPEEAETLCDRGEAIYNAAGAYFDWIEATAGVTLAEGPSLAMMGQASDVTMPTRPDSFQAWCESRDNAAPGWYSIQRLVSLAGDYALANGGDIRRIFEDCAYAEENLRLKIAADKGLDLDAFAPQSFGDKAQITDLSPLSAMRGFGIARLSLTGHSISDFGPLNDLKKMTKLEIISNQAEVTRAFDISSHPSLETLTARHSPGALRYEALVRGKGLRNLEITGDAIPVPIDWSALAIRNLRLEGISLSPASKGFLDLDLPKLNTLAINAQVAIALPRSLPNLQTLDLQGLADFDLPSELPKLRTLSVASSTYRARAGERITFSNLDMLESFRFTGNKGIDALALPPKLERLRAADISNNGLTFLDGFENMAKLATLDISGNRLMNVPYFEALPRLAELDLSDNPMEDLSGMNRNASIVRLKIEHLANGARDNIEDLPDLPSLRELRAGRNSFRSVKEFLRFPKLEVLVLSDNQIRDISNLEVMKQLDYLEVVNNPLEERRCPLRNDKYCRFEWFTGTNNQRSLGNAAYFAIPRFRVPT